MAKYNRSDIYEIWCYESPDQQESMTSVAKDDVLSN